jgi:hypothetical protein
MPRQDTLARRKSLRAGQAAFIFFLRSAQVLRIASLIFFLDAALKCRRPRPVLRLDPPNLERASIAAVRRSRSRSNSVMMFSVFISLLKCEGEGYHKLAILNHWIVGQYLTDLRSSFLARTHRVSPGFKQQAS